MRTSSAKAKGRRPMLWLREKLLEAFPQLQPDDVRVTPSGTPGPDLQLSPAAQQVFPFAVESKNEEKLRLWAALRQVEAHAALSGLPPCLILTKNRSPVWAVVRRDWFRAHPTTGFLIDGYVQRNLNLWNAIGLIAQETRGTPLRPMIHFERTGESVAYVALEATAFLDLLRRVRTG